MSEKHVRASAARALSAVSAYGNPLEFRKPSKSGDDGVVIGVGVVSHGDTAHTGM
jgi:hypothetical protein